MRHVLCAILLSFLTATADAVTIGVRTQQDFDHLSKRIIAEIHSGEREINVDVEAPYLTFSDDQILLKSIKRRDVCINIHGNGVRIMSKGRLVKKVKRPSLMYLKDGDYYNPWTEFRQLSDTISLVGNSTRLCHIATPVKNKRKSRPQDIYINYTCWYTSRTSRVSGIGKKWIEFDGGDWAVPQSGNFFNVNMDYSYAKLYPRYRLFGTKRIRGTLYECESSTLVRMEFCTLRSFSLDGIRVTGSSGGDALIYIDSSHADSISVSNSTFRCIGGPIILDRKSSNVCFTGNKVDTFMGYGIESEVGSTGAKVTNNIFANCTLGMEMCFAIKMQSDNFIVKNNTISDFCYGGIGAGIWGGTKTNCKCRGVISSNELFYTPAFLVDLPQHTLMDSGAIYTWTRCDGIGINNNYIHDISGVKDNRGVFCDDGTRNVSIFGNRIENIHNSYDIDLRWCETYKENVPDHNTGNIMHENRTTGRVRFETQHP